MAMHAANLNGFRQGAASGSSGNLPRLPAQGPSAVPAPRAEVSVFPCLGDVALAMLAVPFRVEITWPGAGEDTGLDEGGHGDESNVDSGR
jgi:hypothetical protein